MNFILMIQQRLLKYNKNFIAICVGGTGSGKSYAMLKFGELVDPNFDITHVVFTLEEFLELLNTGDLPPGSIILWDEGGVEAASREAMTKKNRLLGKIVQTFRHRNLGLLFTVPDMGFVDTQIRTLAHVIFKPISIDRVHNKCLLDVAKIQRNEKLKKTYYKPFKITTGGIKTKSNTFRLGMPSLKIRKAYEEKKTAFTHLLNETELNPIAKVDKAEKLDLHTIAEEILSDKKKWLKKWRKKKIVHKISLMATFGISELSARKVKFMVESQVN